MSYLYKNIVVFGICQVAGLKKQIGTRGWTLSKLALAENCWKKRD
jgi:hypothetical protein